VQASPTQQSRRHGNSEQAQGRAIKGVATPFQPCWQAD
jgi:hypothetical protein